MWDDDQDPGPSEESNGSGIRRKEEIPLDLPLAPESGVHPSLPAARASGVTPPSPPPVRRRKAPPLFPDWDPGLQAPRGPENAAAFARFAGAAPGIDPVPPRLPPASVGARGLAGIADLVAVALLSGILLLSVRLAGEQPLVVGSALWTGFFALEITLVAGALSLFLFGRTPGMALAALRAEEAEGEPIRFGRAALRTAVALAGTLLPGVGLLFSAVRDDHRSLTDLVSGTVLRADEELPGEVPEDEPLFSI